MRLSQDARFIASESPSFVRMMRGGLGVLRDGIVRAGISWTERRQRARDAEQLATFSDRELWDLGLGRSDLSAISRGIYRRG